MKHESMANDFYMEEAAPVATSQEFIGGLLFILIIILIIGIIFFIFDSRIKAKMEKINSKRSICAICHRNFNGEDSIRCQYCSSYFHVNEILEWLKIKGTCPICKRKLDLSNLQKLIICFNCNQRIPCDSNYCVFCGFKIKIELYENIISS